LMFLDHTQRRSTVGRTSLDEWSARRRDLYLTTHSTHNRQTSMPPVRFEPTISAGERPQTYGSDRAATGTGFILQITPQIFCLQFGSFGVISKKMRVFFPRRLIQSFSVISYITNTVKYKSWYNEQSVIFLGCRIKQGWYFKGQRSFSMGTELPSSGLRYCVLGQWRNNTLLLCRTVHQHSNPQLCTSILTQNCAPAF
jgi:hypothetical protein